MSAPLPINVYQSSTQTPANQMTMIGNGHIGAGLMTRIIMSLKSSVESEVEWALSSLYQQSYIAPDTIDFEKTQFLGNKLIEYFMRPFNLIKLGDFNDINNKMINLSLDALLSLRNCIQDLKNQQWLSQVYEFKQYLIDVLKFLHKGFSTTGFPFVLHKYNDQFMEYLYHSIDILDTLTCYYINNPKTDELFNIILSILISSTDKYLIIGTLNCLTHLLFTRAEMVSDNENKEYNDQNAVAGVDGTNISAVARDEVAEEALLPIFDNCIDNFNEDHLEHFLNYLLVNDPKLNVAVLDFLKQYLLSGASNKNQSVKQSRFNRLSKLLQINGLKHNLHTLFKQLPLLMVTDVRLNDPINDIGISQELAKRSTLASVPIETPLLTSDLYDIISKFNEPLRSSIWLRCCYEPIFSDSYDDTNSGSGGVIGEVTQISLWKAYEKQFEKIWMNKPNDYPELLPAVDFIKNVTKAFPNSEAMVVMPTDSENSKKKFIIRGIQPRQFAVGIDVGNYEAYRRKIVLDKRDIDENLPIGTVDQKKFQNSLKSLNSKILFTDNNLRYNKVNLHAKDALDFIIKEIPNFQNPDELVSIFRLYNRGWLLDLIYANPVLVELNLIGNDWVQYLV